MISRTFEWYRIVNPEPTDETVTKRKLAAQTLIEKLDAADDYGLLVACVSGVVNGFDNGLVKDDFIKSILGSITDHQPAFPSDLSQNALELRVCASLAVGECLIRPSEQDDTDTPTDSVLAATLLISGAGLRPQADGEYLGAMLAELDRAARSTLELAAAKKRKRTDLNLKAFDELPVPADIPTLWKELLPKLSEFISQLNDNARSDREELQLLWSLYGEYSDVAQKPVASLKPQVAALCCAVDLAELTQLPPLESTREMLINAIEKNRKKLEEMTLEEITRLWSIDQMKVFTPSNPKHRELTKTYPSLLPLTWLCLRIEESGVTTGWTDEFQVKTGFSPSHQYSPRVIGRQIFDEYTTRRICAKLPLGIG